MRFINENGKFLLLMNHQEYEEFINTYEKFLNENDKNWKKSSFGNIDYPAYTYDIRYRNKKDEPNPIVRTSLIIKEFGKQITVEFVAPPEFILTRRK